MSERGCACGWAPREGVIGGETLDEHRVFCLRRDEPVVSDRIPRFMKLHEDAQIPHRHYADDIGWDLAARLDRPMRIPPGEYADVPSDLAVELPLGTWGMLVGRSSALRQHGLIISMGIIDVGYTGQLFSGAFNATSRQVVVAHGMRLSQLIIVPRYDPETERPIEVNQLRETLRGAAGFGSTGT